MSFRSARVVAIRSARHDIAVCHGFLFRGYYERGGRRRLSQAEVLERLSNRLWGSRRSPWARSAEGRMKNALLRAELFRVAGRPVRLTPSRPEIIGGFGW